ncbi:MAG TPA: hypothetical protein VK737_00760 [Opitutales bacterium]|jgi:hypothetical protein|nr:hypothetical protein [Opitutales bacterium]
MSQDSNTTSDTNPKPRLQIARPKDAPPASENPSPQSAPAAPAAVPRFSFARKKAAPEPTPAPAAPTPAPSGPPLTTGNTGGSQLKRPPTGSRLFVAHEIAAPEGTMPAPLTPVTRGVTHSPFAAKPKAPPRSNKLLLIILGLLVIVVGGESYYILMQDQQAADIIKAAPPVVIANTAQTVKPTEITATTVADSPAAKFLQEMSVDFVDAGASPKLSIGGEVYHPGEVVDKDTGLKWIRIDDKTREMEFTDKQGRHYIKKF